jgi:hypothetical protein
MTLEHLRDFASDGSHGGNQPPISLHDLLARGTSIHWDEAVAIVGEMCDVLIATSGDGAAVPELADVLIGREGAVTMRRNRGDESPAAAGRTLHMLLANADVPMPLRLFVTRSTAPETYSSLRDFAAGLAYFGKPERARLIQDVYRRCGQAQPSNVLAAPVPPPLPPAATDAKTAPDPKRSPKRRLVRTALASASVCLAGGAAWIWAGGASQTTVEGNAARVFSKAAAVLADLSQQVRDTLTTRVAEPAQSADSTAKPPTQRTSRMSRVRPLEDGIKAPLASRTALPSNGGLLRLAVAIPQTVAPALAEFDPEPQRDLLDAPIYSKDDADVEPPALLFPQLTPLPAAPGTSPDLVNRMVVDVSADGTVERVQLIAGPSRLPDMMLLSGAKTWKFTPALKNGDPVRYRTVVSWAGLP